MMLLNLIPAPYRWFAWLAVAVALFGAGWTAQGWRKDNAISALQKQYDDQALAAQVAARKKEQDWNKQLEDARNAATQRETILRRDASNARTAVDGLRNELASIKRNLPNLAADAVRQRADTLSDLLGECSGRYQELAEETDRIASDRQTLIEAWPK